jgi:hypothetical protein
MSEENVENIRQAVEAFNRRDADAFVARMSRRLGTVPGSIAIGSIVSRRTQQR